MNPLKVFIHKFIPFTSGGRVFLILSLSFLTIGLIRDELGALLWGGAVLFLLLFSLVISFLIRRALISSINSPNLKVFPGRIFPDERVEVIYNIPLPGIPLIGFTITLESCFTWENRRVPLRIPLSSGENEGSIELFPSRRGNYTLKEERICIEDPLGFTRTEIRRVLMASFRVLPLPLEVTNLPDPSKAHGNGSDGARKKRRTELLDSRKYYPGDDVRRLNWKQYAHLGELYLRQGEETPEHRRKQLLLLDLSGEDTDEVLEGMLCLAGGILTRLEERGIGLSLPGKFIGAGTKELRGLQDLLAGLWWSEAPHKIQEVPGVSELSELKELSVLLISRAGSPLLPKLLRDLQGSQVHLFLKEREQVSLPVTWQDRLLSLLFYREQVVADGDRRGGEIIDRSARRGDTYDEEALKEFRKGRWGINHVEVF